MEDTDAIESSEVSYIVSERDFVSLLIDLYRNRPVLWKVKHPHYANKHVRAEAVDEIAKELQTYKPDFTADNVKKKINIIRTNYNKEKHRVERWRLEGRANAKPNLWYYNELLFLDEQDFPEGFHRIQHTANTDIQEWNEPTFEFSEASDVKHIPDDEEEAEAESTPKKARKIQKFKNVTVKRRRVDVEPEPEEIELENGKEEEEPEQYMTITTTYYKKPKKREDLLADTWAMKLKRMSVEQKIFAEKIINDVLFEGELGNLTRNGVSFL